jgi:rhodanese-related sulfurtransferase
MKRSPVAGLCAAALCCSLLIARPGLAQDAAKEKAAAAANAAAAEAKAKASATADATTTEVKNLNAADARKVLDDNAAAVKKDKGKTDAITILDVRTAKEYGAERIAGSKNIDFRGKDFAEQIGKLDRAKPYLVHCRSGGRSTSSLEVFKKLGFKTIYHLDGGIDGWKKAGLPVEK